MGFNIEWKGKRILSIMGSHETKELTHSVMPDRIEAGTYIIAAAITSGEIKITNIDPKIMSTEISLLNKMKVTTQEIEAIEQTEGDYFGFQHICVYEKVLGFRAE